MKIIPNSNKIKISDLKIGDILIIKDRNDMYFEKYMHEYIDHDTGEAYDGAFIPGMELLWGKSFEFVGYTGSIEMFFINDLGWSISIDMIKNLI